MVRTCTARQNGSVALAPGTLELIARGTPEIEPGLRLSGKPRGGVGMCSELRRELAPTS